MMELADRDRECPNCKSDKIDVVLCEDFLDDAEWFEYKCKDCDHTWEENAP